MNLGKRIIAAIVYFAVVEIAMPPAIGTAIWTYTDCGGFRSYQERLEFHRISRKHFHPKRIAIVYDWPKDPHFFDDKGRRCTFK